MNILSFRTLSAGRFAITTVPLLFAVFANTSAARSPTRQSLPTVPLRSGKSFHASSQRELYLHSSRGGAAKDDHCEGGTASITSSVFNLVNNVAGAGILTLSAGMAKGTGLVPALAICAVLGVVSSHTFTIIGESCAMLGENDFKGLWSKTISEKSNYIVDSIIAVMCLACLVIYSGILGDVFTPLLASAGVPDSMNSRTKNIIGLTVSVLFPLSSLKDLSALSFTSVLGFMSILYTIIFLCVRALDGSYNAMTGKFVIDNVIAKPSFLKQSVWNVDFTSLVLASNLGLAYIAHYNAPTFYRELKDVNSQRFSKMVKISFAILTSLYVLSMMSGYNTFGDICEGNILLNYHPGDILSTFGRVATGTSILFGFPLVAVGAREGLAGVATAFGMNAIAEENNRFALVALILAVVTYISCTVKDVSFVVGVTGAVMGSLIVYIIPAIIYSNAVKISKGQDSDEYKTARYNNILVPFGTLIAALGVFMTVKETS